MFRTLAVPRLPAAAAAARYATPVIACDANRTFNSRMPASRNDPFRTRRLVDGLRHVQRLRESAIPCRERYSVADCDKRAGRHPQAPDFAGVVEWHDPHHSGAMAAPCSNDLCAPFVANNIRFDGRLSVAS